jgi:hypothetical protein
MDEKEKPINETITTQTGSSDNNENFEPNSKWQRFCKRYGINHNLVMLKMTLFFMHGGE